MDKTKNVKLTFFTADGRYHAQETVAVPAGFDQAFQIVHWLETNVKSYRGMDLVAMLDEYDNCCPVIIPAARRR